MSQYWIILKLVSQSRRSKIIAVVIVWVVIAALFATLGPIQSEHGREGDAEARVGVFLQAPCIASVGFVYLVGGPQSQNQYHYWIGSGLLAIASALPILTRNAKHFVILLAVLVVVLGSFYWGISQSMIWWETHGHA